MKHLFLLAIITLSIAIHASAQFTNVFNNDDKGVGPNSTSAAGDSILSHVRILPNPASGMIVLMVGDEDANVLNQAEVVIYSNAGYPVAKKAVTTGTSNIYVNNLSSGLYFLRLIQKNGQSAVKEFGVLR